MLFGLRFDFRNPAFAGTTMTERYAAALDMAAWADALGCVNISISEHHGSDDGYLPSPIPVLAAMAARTTQVRFAIAALIAPFYDPIRLAEDMVVLDNLSGGRVDLIVAAGYVHEEFAMYDVPMSERGKRVAETVTTLKAAFSGEPFEFRGRTIQVTPAPDRPGGPSVSMGGSSKPAAVRAARLADGFIPTDAEVWQYYRDEVLALGRPDPGASPIDKVETVALAKDVEVGWKELGPYFLHETNAYGIWQAQDDISSPYRRFDDIDALREGGIYRIITPDEMIEEQKAAPFPFGMFHPMCGGIPPELAWTSLKLFEDEVLPAFS
jgi:alkanesulfonate monooxygenase SsuD/methylene tetrahydromethanopterin reductase-like flavin-dependent oxidoreductase (luciferase family)